MLDLALADGAKIEAARDVRSQRDASLQTNHCLVTCVVALCLDSPTQSQAPRKGGNALGKPAVAN
eukprot:4005826-Pyramimonas_sp.AAC.1